MSDNPSKEAFNDLLAYVEQVDTRIGAVLQFLRENGTITDEKLASYLEHASKASDVRRRAMRARIDHLFTADEKAKPATEAVPAANRKEGQETPHQQPKARQEEPRKPAPEKKTESTEKTASIKPKTEEQQQSTQPEKKEPSEIVAGREAVKDGGANKKEDKRPRPESNRPEKKKEAA